MALTTIVDAKSRKSPAHPRQVPNLGQTSYYDVYLDANSQPEPNTEQSQYYTNRLSNFQMREEDLAGLVQILSYNGTDTNVIIVEMPVPDGYFYFFENG